jgi:hypothetical protein
VLLCADGGVRMVLGVGGAPLLNPAISYIESGGRNNQVRVNRGYHIDKGAFS